MTVESGSKLLKVRIPVATASVAHGLVANYNDCPSPLNITFIFSAGPRPPVTPMLFLPTRVADNLAVIHLLIPLLVYLPETYSVTYQVTGAPASTAVVSQLVNSTTNLSAVIQEYFVVLRDLQPNTEYSFNITSENIVGTTRSTSNTFRTTSTESSM